MKTEGKNEPEIKKQKVVKNVISRRFDAQLRYSFKMHKNVVTLNFGYSMDLVTLLWSSFNNLTR